MSKLLDVFEAVWPADEKTFRKPSEGLDVSRERVGARYRTRMIKAFATAAVATPLIAVPAFDILANTVEGVSNMVSRVRVPLWSDANKDVEVKQELAFAVSSDKEFKYLVEGLALIAGLGVAGYSARKFYLAGKDAKKIDEIDKAITRRNEDRMVYQANDKTKGLEP